MSNQLNLKRDIRNDTKCIRIQSRTTMSLDKVPIDPVSSTASLSTATTTSPAHRTV